MTQPELAEALDVSPKMIDYYERRCKNPSSELVMKIAAFFDVGVAYLLVEEGGRRLKPGPKSKLEKRFEEVRKLPPKQQELVLIMIDSFLAQARAS